jgi:hypothetical protein
MDGINRAIDGLNRGIQSIRRVLAGDEPIGFVRQAAVRIWVVNGSGYRIEGSGNVVEFEGLCFVSTCAHVSPFFNSSSVNYSLRLPDEIKLSMRGASVLFDDEHDVSLIPIECPDKVHPLKISESPLRLGTQLWGVSDRSSGTVLLHCRVTQEKRDNTTETDCGGSPGFSGTGLVSWDDFLVGIHRGSGVHMEVDAREESLGQRSMHLKSSCNVTSLPLPLDCFDAFHDIIELTSRNPRSWVVSADYLYELWKRHNA